MHPHGLQPARLLCPWDSPGKNTGVGCHALLQEIFPTQGSNPGLPHFRWILYHLSHQGSPRLLGQVAYLFSRTAPNVTFDGCTLQGANKSGTIVYGYASSTSNAVIVKNCTADNLQYIVSSRQTGSSSVLIENVIATNMIYLARTLKCPSVTVKDVTCDAVIGIEIKNDAAGGKLTLENVNINIVTYGGSLYAPVSGSGAGNSWGN